MSAATTAEIRAWAQGLGLPIPARGHLPDALLDRWDREHPDRPAPRTNGQRPPASTYSAGWRKP